MPTIAERMTAVEAKVKVLEAIEPAEKAGENAINAFMRDFSAKLDTKTDAQKIPIANALKAALAGL